MKQGQKRKTATWITLKGERFHCAQTQDKIKGKKRFLPKEGRKTEQKGTFVC